MSLAEAGAARARKRPLLEAHRGPASDRTYLPIDDSGQGIKEHKLESRTERTGSAASGKAISAAPDQSAVSGDLTPSQTAQRLVEWSAAKRSEENTSEL